MTSPDPVVPPEPGPDDDVTVLIGGTLAYRDDNGVGWTMNILGWPDWPWARLMRWAGMQGRDVEVLIPALRLAIAAAERDEARATIARVEALCAEFEDECEAKRCTEPGCPWLRLRAALAHPEEAP